MRPLRKLGLTPMWVLLCLLGLMWPKTLEAREPLTEWGTPELLSEPGQRCDSATLLATEQGTVHAFWSCARDADDRNSPWDIYYSFFDGHWSSPIDVVAGGRYIDAVFDETGRAHLFWSSGPGTGLHHAWSVADELRSAHSWSQPVQLGEGTQEFGVAVDDDGRIHLASTPSVRDVVYIRSDDAGRRWSSPVTVNSPTPDVAYRYADVAVDSRGGLHIVWSSYPLPDAWPPLGVFYSQSEDGGRTWSVAKDLSLEERSEGVPGEWSEDEPVIEAFGEDLVCAVWNGGIVSRRRFVRCSEDGGTTWPYATAVMLPKGGIVGRSAVTMDSTGRFHVALPTGEDSGLYYAAGRVGGFSPPLRLASGWEFGQVALAISQGNTLHLLYPEKSEGIYALTATIDAPYVQPATPAAPVSDPSPTPPPIPDPTATPTVALPAFQGEEVSDSVDPLHVLLVGSGLPLLIVMGVIAWQFSRSRR